MNEVNKLIAKEIALKVIQLAATKVTPGLQIAMNQPGYGWRREANMDYLAETFWAYFATEEFEAIKDEKAVRYPSGPWEFFKFLYFPEWLLERFPVKFKIEKVSLVCVPSIIYPTLKIPSLKNFKQVYSYVAEP